MRALQWLTGTPWGPARRLDICLFECSRLDIVVTRVPDAINGSLCLQYQVATGYLEVSAWTSRLDIHMHRPPKRWLHLIMLVRNISGAACGP